MKNVKFEMKKWDDVKKMYGLDDNNYKGRGIYKIDIGCRGFIESVKKMSDNDEYKIMSEEEFKNVMIEINGMDEEYVDEFCFVDENDGVWGFVKSEDEGYDLIGIE